jgi:class 3 adenylate cyclase
VAPGSRRRAPSAARRWCPERFASPEVYTPRYLAERILTSRAAMEGERKQMTVLFADLRGSMDLLADRDPEEARTLLDAVLERMMEAVHRYEGTVNQVMGDGIMALFGAPLASEDHAVRACYAALRMQESIKRSRAAAPGAHASRSRSCAAACCWTPATRLARSGCWSPLWRSAVSTSSSARRCAR